VTSLAKKDLTENTEQRMPIPYFKFSSIISEKVFFCFCFVLFFWRPKAALAIL